MSVATSTSQRSFKQFALGSALMLGFALGACAPAEEEGASDTPSVYSGKATTGSAPLSDAEVLFDIGGQSFRAVTDAAGAFSVDFGNILGSAPPYIAGTLYKDGYLIQTINLSNSNGRVRGSDLLTTGPLGSQDVAILNPASSGPLYRITHLGDQNFTGSANSQLQVSSSGTRINVRLGPISKAQVAQYPAGLCLVLDVRGLENVAQPTRITLNSQSQNMNASASDGSFSRQSYCFTDVYSGDASRFNTLIIESGNNSSGTDYDDFEFINVTGSFSTAQPPRVFRIDAGDSSTWVADQAVSFDTVDATIYDSYPAQIDWSFGDDSPVLSVRNLDPVTHAYSKTGTFTVKAVARDASDQVLAQATLNLQIQPKHIAGASVGTITRASDNSLEISGRTDFKPISIRVTWPDGTVDEQYDVSTDTYTFKSASTAYEAGQISTLLYFNDTSLSPIRNYTAPARR